MMMKAARLVWAGATTTIGERKREREKKEVVSRQCYTVWRRLKKVKISQKCLEIAVSWVRFFHRAICKFWPKMSM